MPSIDYNDRRFVSRANTENGEVSAETVFHYRQEGGVVWATYAGGGIRFGTLLAQADADGGLDMRYQHVNAEGEWRSGICRSTPEILPDGRVRLHERWRWTSGDGSSGESIIEEMLPGKVAE